MVPEDLTPPEVLQDFKVIASHTGLHSVSSPGILCMDLQGSTIVTGGSDKSVVVFNKDTEQVVASFKGHSKKVMSVLCHPNEVSNYLDFYLSIN